MQIVRDQVNKMGEKLSNIHTGTINRGSGAQCTYTFKDKRGEKKKKNTNEKKHITWIRY